MDQHKEQEEKILEDGMKIKSLENTNEIFHTGVMTLGGSMIRMMEEMETEWNKEMSSLDICISKSVMMSPIPATMFSVFNAMSPYEFMLMTQQEIQMHQNKMVPTSGSERSSGDRPAPQRIQTFHEAVGVWTHRFSESLFNRLVRKMPGIGFKFWGPKIQKLNIARFLFNSKQANPSADASDYPRLKKNESNQWKTFIDFLKELMTERFQAGLIFQPRIKPE
ncbi:hypothetical protein CAEBREN_02532 [Caenorhabditis brenneri]|uniref:Uncharacterized protein n=1 Tax=Caenorhabditis brenneri TaxID=135651 RepID=G0NKE3_CAEBE|nr:hypothetical protein CAEBREN_02532 [Caenorhabditis brenneri]